MQTNGKGLNQCAFLCGHPFGQLEAHIRRECNIVLIAALHRRSCKENNIGTEVISAGFTEFAVSAGDTGFQCNLVAHLQVCYAFAQLFYNAACFMAQHQLAVNHKVAASAVLEIMHIRTTNPNIFNLHQNLARLGFGNGCLSDFHFVQSNHISCSVFHLLSPRFRFIEIQFYQFSGTSPARRSPFYDNSIDGIMQELRTFQNTVFHEKK